MDGLASPTNVAIARDGRIFLAEQATGDVRIIEDGVLLPAPFDHVDVVAGAETGLLGLALHPGFPDRPWVYVYYSDAADGRNRLIRILADGNRGTDRQNLIDGLETANGYHNGGDIAFALDGSLLLSVGEAHESARAQDPNDIGGKVLRIEADGTLAPDNPFGPDNPVYSIGHRNSFGLCVDPATGDLWETENGPEIDDEVNRVVAGAQLRVARAARAGRRAAPPRPGGRLPLGHRAHGVRGVAAETCTSGPTPRGCCTGSGCPPSRDAPSTRSLPASTAGSPTSRQGRTGFCTWRPRTRSGGSPGGPSA